MTAGFLSVGADVLLLGPVRTPAVGFLTRSMRADVGVHDLGLAQSLRGQRHASCSDPTASSWLRMPSRRRSKGWLHPPLTSGWPHPDDRLRQATGRCRRPLHQTVKASVRGNLDLTGLKIVVDCANGAAYKVAPTVLAGARRRGDPDGGVARWPQHQRQLRLDLSSRCCRSMW